VEGARFVVPAVDFVGMAVCSVFFGQGGALPEVPGCLPGASLSGLDAFFADSSAEGVVGIVPYAAVRGVGLQEPIEVVPSVAPGLGAEAVAGQPFFDDPAADVIAVAAVADGSDGAAFVAMGPAVALGQVQQGVIAVVLDGLGVQAGVAGDLLDLVAGVVVAAVAAAPAVLDADQSAGGVVAVAAGDLGQFVVDGELSVPSDQLARQSTAGVVALFEGEGVAGGLLRRLVLPLGFQAASPTITYVRLAYG